MTPRAFPPRKSLSDEEIVLVVEQDILRWKATCDNPDAEMVIFHQKAFGTTADDLFLIGIVIKYAGIQKKEITVIPYPRSRQPAAQARFAYLFVLPFSE